MLNRIKNLVIKEFLAIWRDKKSRVILIVPPMLQLFIFSFAATLEVKNVPIAVFNRDTGRESWELVQRFEGSPYFTDIHYIYSDKAVKEYINSQKALMVIQINDDFSSRINSGQQAEIQLILDGRKTNVSQILAGYVNGIIDRYNRDIKPEAQVRRSSQNAIRKGKLTASPFLSPASRSEIVPRNWFNENLDYIWFTVPGIVGILTMLISLIITSLSVAREREFGTFDQLLVSPLESTEILIGKTVPAFIIGMLEGTFFIIAGIVFFNLPHEGSFLHLYFGMSVFLLAIIGIGLLISSVSKTQQQAILGAFAFMTPTIILSGYATPIENMPLWLQEFTVINPLKHFLIIIKGVLLKNVPFDVVLEHTIPIAVFAVISLSVSTRMFKQRLE